MKTKLLKEGKSELEKRHRAEGWFGEKIAQILRNIGENFQTIKPAPSVLASFKIDQS